MSDIAIKIENLSKQYRLGNVGTGTLTHDLKSWWASARGKEDPNLQIGLENKLAEKGGEYVFALKDINLEIKKGDIVGVIGKNGAGKSTLLKILSRVTTPTTGSIDLYGRVASLLEVGTGFHPELTGRENIFLNGAIMGMTKQEIKLRFDEIVDFAGVEKYIDTPVKRYSSGMYVRLGFAVAAHLEPEILIVDEVLAVGDIEFQKKAMGKMKDVSRNEGRTILFVSHNMTAIKNICSKGIVLVNGKIDYDGQINEAIDLYNSVETVKGITNNQWDFENAPGLEKIKVKSAYVEFEGTHLNVNSSFNIVSEFWCMEENFSVNLSMHLYDMNGQCIFNISTKNQPLKKGLHKAIFFIPKQFMNDGFYYINNMFVSDSKCYYHHENANSFEITEDREASAWHGKWTGTIRPTFIKHDYIFVNPI